jgi:hypothetical protein
LFSLLRADADRSQEQELSGRVEDSFRRVKRFGKVIGLHSFMHMLRFDGLSSYFLLIHLDFHTQYSSSMR